MMKDRRYLVSVVGPTAVGKTSFGIQLAKRFQTEVISLDSRQFYKETDLGTAKPDVEERSQARHHFVDTLSIHDTYTVADFETDALKLLQELFADHNVVIAVGGSGLFCKALWHGLDEMPDVRSGVRERLNQEFAESGLDPLVEELKNSDSEYYHTVDLKNHQRIIRALEVIRSSGKPFSSFRNSTPEKPREFQNIKIGLNMERAILFDRINRRMDQMIANGLFEEAEKLFPLRHLNALQTVGYSEIFGYLEGKYDREESVRLLKRNSRRYAKRQLTWFSKDPEIKWFQPDQLNEVIDQVEKLINS